MTETGETIYNWQVWTNLNVAGTAYLKDPTSTCAGWTSAAIADSARVGLNAPAPGLFALTGKRVRELPLARTVAV